MSAIPGFHFIVGAHLKANQKDLADVTTVIIEGYGKPGGDSLQYATVVGAQPGQNITVETRSVGGQSYNLRSSTNTWDLRTYPSNSPVELLMKGRLALQSATVRDVPGASSSLYVLDGVPQVPQSDSGRYSVKMWIDPVGYNTVIMEVVAPTSLPREPWFGSAVEEWQFIPLKKIYVVDVPEGLPPPVSMLPSTGIAVPGTDELIAMILKQYSQDTEERYVVGPKTDSGVTGLGAAAVTLYGVGAQSIVQRFSLGGYDATELVNRLSEVNSVSIPLTLQPGPGDGYSIDYEDRFSKYPKEDLNAFWKQWHADNPQAFGYLRISIPATDTKTGYILVYLGLQWGSLAGQGEILAYRYWEGKLYQIGSVILWLS